jgi:hypothetical protein
MARQKESAMDIKVVTLFNMEVGLQADADKIEMIKIKEVGAASFWTWWSDYALAFEAEAAKEAIAWWEARLEKEIAYPPFGGYTKEKKERVVRLMKAEIEEMKGQIQRGERWVLVGVYTSSEEEQDLRWSLEIL